MGEAGLHAGADGGCVCIREPGIPLCLDSGSELHFHLVGRRALRQARASRGARHPALFPAAVSWTGCGQTGLYAGANTGAVPPGSRHPTGR